jgi:hypothetical protein
LARVHPRCDEEGHGFAPVAFLFVYPAIARSLRVRQLHRFPGRGARGARVIRIRITDDERVQARAAGRRAIRPHVAPDVRRGDREWLEQQHPTLDVRLADIERAQCTDVRKPLFASERFATEIAAQTATRPTWGASAPARAWQPAQLPSRWMRLRMMRVVSPSETSTSSG